MTALEPDQDESGSAQRLGTWRRSVHSVCLAYECPACHQANEATFELARITEDGRVRVMCVNLGCWRAGWIALDEWTTR